MKYYSNEVVFRGHPDKVCDQISAAILAECMKQDVNTRAGIEVAGGKGRIFITGELTTKAVVDPCVIARQVLEDVGYVDIDYEIIDNIGRQSGDIALGVDVGGAGDQGMMFGYACDETKDGLPVAMVILQQLSKAYDALRKIDKRFKPDGKAQITGVYDADFRLVSIKDFTISYQNTEKERHATDIIIRDVAKSICASYGIEVERWLINPTGKFELGGFEADAGLTGRKIVVDAYQSFANVGGGCMNGKDPTKVDFSGAHAARSIALAYLDKYCLKWCEVQLSYAIGIARPLAIYIDSDKGSLEAPDALYEACEPRNIIRNLDLKNFDFVEAAAFGHFRWEYE